MSREMKVSGIEWITKIPVDWYTTKLKYITKNLDSMRIPIEASQRNINGDVLYPYYGANGILDYIDSYIFDYPSILIGEDGSVMHEDNTPYVNFADGKYWVNNHAHIYVEKKGSELRYLYYLISVSDIHNLTTGTTMLKLTQSNLANLRLIVPSLTEQQTIANFLDNKCSKIDNAISKQKSIIEKLKEYKQSIITETVTKGLEPDVEMKDSGIEWIGKIPSNWNLQRFKFTHLKANVGENVDRSMYGNNEGNLKFYTAGLNFTTTSYYDFPKWKYTNKNDLLMARNGTPYVYLPTLGAVYSDHIIRAEIKYSYDKRYIKYCLQQSISATVIDSVSIATWSIAVWDKQFLPIPSTEVQQAIADYLDKKCSQIDEAITRSNTIIEKLEEYKKSIIFEYVTGKKEAK